MGRITWFKSIEQNIPDQEIRSALYEMACESDALADGMRHLVEENDKFRTERIELMAKLEESRRQAPSAQEIRANRLHEEKSFKLGLAMALISAGAMMALVAIVVAMVVR